MPPLPVPGWGGRKEAGGLKRGPGGILCLCEAPLPIDRENCFIPSVMI